MDKHIGKFFGLIILRRFFLKKSIEEVKLKYPPTTTIQYFTWSAETLNSFKTQCLYDFDSATLLHA